MRGLRQHLLEQVAAWDTPTKAGLTIAVALLVVMGGVYAFAGEAWRLPSIAAIVALIGAIQVLVMWGNRRMVTPFTAAQRLYLDGEVEQARHMLEARRGEEDVDLQELTLLGNIYRQMGDLQKSESVLFEALNISPRHHFPLYGLGRTQLAKSDYETAASNLLRALENGAPPVIRADLIEAYYRSGESKRARAALAELDDALPMEPYRRLMTDYIRYVLGEGDAPTVEVIAAGLPYWEAAAVRLADTPYGQAVAEDVQALKQGA